LILLAVFRRLQFPDQFVWTNEARLFSPVKKGGLLTQIARQLRRVQHSENREITGKNSDYQGIFRENAVPIEIFQWLNLKLGKKSREFGCLFSPGVVSTPCLRGRYPKSNAPRSGCSGHTVFNPDISQISHLCTQCQDQ
jgi:hypothetical protein